MRPEAAGGGAPPAVAEAVGRLTADRPRLGMLLAGLGVVLSLFLPWFGVSTGAVPSAVASGAGIGDTPSATGWHALALLDLGLAALGLSVAGFALAGAAGRKPLGPDRAARIAIWGGAAATVLIVYRMVVPPDLLGLPDVAGGLASLVGVETKASVGAYLGLASAVGVVWAGWLAGTQSVACGSRAAAHSEPAATGYWGVFAQRMREELGAARQSDNSRAVASFVCGMVAVAGTLVMLINNDLPAEVGLASIATAVAAWITGGSGLSRLAEGSLSDSQTMATTGRWMGRGVVAFWVAALVYVLVVGLTLANKVGAV